MKYLKNKFQKRSKKLKQKELEKQNNQIRDGWRTLCFAGVSGFLGFLLINNSWEPITYKNIYVQGNINFSRNTILKSSGINSMTTLLRVNPKQVQSNLISLLALEAASIHRQLIPPRLVIRVLERKPIAYARRSIPEGFENGMVDKNAEWIPIENIKKKKNNDKKIELHIFGWSSSQKEWISFILSHRENLGTPLKAITLKANGEITLTTKNFEAIHLGANTDLLEKQMKIIAHLNNSLPKTFINKSGISIDLRDPTKPEMQTADTN